MPDRGICRRRGRSVAVNAQNPQDAFALKPPWR
jgi:hypothetical protein